jgi:hypothetical protein
MVIITDEMVIIEIQSCIKSDLYKLHLRQDEDKWKHFEWLDTSLGAGSNIYHPLILFPECFGKGSLKRTGR